MVVDVIKSTEIPNADIPAMFQYDTAIAMPEAKLDPVFGIRIGSVGFFISTAVYCEVLDKIQVNTLPNIHPWISGILNLRGNLVPLFDLLTVFEQPVDNKKRRLFAIDRGEKAVALWIDGFPEIKDKATFKPLKILPTLPPIVQRFVTDGYEHDGQVWLDIKFEDLFKALGRHQYAAEEELVE